MNSVKRGMDCDNSIHLKNEQLQINPQSSPKDTEYEVRYQI